MAASAPSTSPATAGLGERAYDGLEPFQWPLRDGQGASDRLFAEGGFFTPDRKARFIAVEAPPRRPRGLRRLAVRAQHRPHSRPVAHDDAHGAVAAACEPHRRAVRGDPSRRCRAPRPGAGTAGACRDGARRDHPARSRLARAAAGHAVRAHSLVGREQPRAGRSAPSCRRRPTRTPASPSRRQRLRTSPPWPCRTSASRCRESRSGSQASAIGPPHARRSGTCSTSRSMRLPPNGRRGSPRRCPRVSG